MPIDHAPRGVHLVGSVPLANAEEVFRTTSEVLGARLRRIPDGETGQRATWIGWHQQVFASHPAFEPDPTDSDLFGRQHYRLRSGVDAREIGFGPLGYADAARASYAVFSQLREQGVIPRRCRFQVSLPTPLAPVNAHVASRDRSVVEPLYEARMLDEVAQMVAAIPPDQLALQWDVAPEMTIWEGVSRPHFPDVKPGIVARLVRLAQSIPDQVELGYHLCYGDRGHRHTVEPTDTASCVAVANGVSAVVRRPIQWIHLPVPIERDDDAYFAPLRELRLHPETELYLGLVHIRDGVEGSRRRIAAASRVVREFGVATECGMGRRPPERGGAPDRLRELLQIHAEVAAPVA